MTTAVCRHHWLIEPNHGAMSAGICRNCGERREFTNWEPAGGLNLKRKRMPVADPVRQLGSESFYRNLARQRWKKAARSR